MDYTEAYWKEKEKNDQLEIDMEKFYAEVVPSLKALQSRVCSDICGSNHVAECQTVKILLEKHGETW